MNTACRARVGVIAIALTSALVVGCGDDEGDDGSGGSATGGSAAGGNAAGGMAVGGQGMGGQGTGGMAGECEADVEAVMIADNHMNNPHMLTIPEMDVVAGQEMTYMLTMGGGNLHAHDVTVSMADFTTLASGDEVVVTSTVDGNNPHSHDVTLGCSQ